MQDTVTVKITGFDDLGFPIVVYDFLDDPKSETLVLTFIRDQAVKFNQYKFGAKHD